MKVIGYLRVSTAEQGLSGAGLEAQRAAIAVEAERRGWDVRWIEDAGFSAKTLDRPGIIEALDCLERGEAEALVAAKLDRLSRSLLDFAGLMDRSQKKGWGLVALDLGVDTSTPSGEMMANVLASFAQFERRLIGQRTKDALAIKKAEGVRLGRPSQLPDAVRRRIIRDREAGRSLREIAEQLNAEHISTAQGGRCWYASTVRSAVLTKT